MKNPNLVFLPFFRSHLSAASTQISSMSTYNFDINIQTLSDHQLSSLIKSSDEEQTEELLVLSGQQEMAGRKLKRCYGRNQSKVHLLVVPTRMERRTEAGIELSNRASILNITT